MKTFHYAPIAEEKVEKMRKVTEELLASAEYWSDYDVSVGIVARMKDAVK